MTADAERPTVPCPRCGSATSPTDRFCATCGLRLSWGSASGDGGKRSSGLQVGVLFGPAIGGVIGFLLGEAIVSDSCRSTRRSWCRSSSSSPSVRWLAVPRCRGSPIAAGRRADAR